MANDSALNFAINLPTAELFCDCGHSWHLQARRATPGLQIECPICEMQHILDEPTAIRINQELNDFVSQVAQKAVIAFEPIPMPKLRLTRRKPKRREPKGYPVGLVGESHYQPAIRRCREGQPVFLWKEPDNPYDPRAIVVTSDDGGILGYIPKGSFIHRLAFDEGGGCTAEILNLNSTPDGPGNIGVVIDIEICDDPLPVRSYTQSR